METTTTYDEKAYESLEREFAARVKRDNRDFEERVKGGDYRGIYLPNVRPTVKVDYVLVGMEPSLGGWAKDLIDAQIKISGGFRNGVGKTLEFSIENYLCQERETWYLTALAKGAMLTKSPDAGSLEKYKAWYPLLEKELELVAKSDARVIAIGTRVGGFLSKKRLSGYAGTIPHYSTQAISHWGKEIQGKEEEFRNFMPEPPQRKKPKDWTDSEKKLLFDYKILFECIRDKKKLDG